MTMYFQAQYSVFFFILDTPGTSGITVVTRKYIYDLMQKQNLSTLEEKLKFIENHLLSRYGDSPVNISGLKQRLAHFKFAIRQKWAQADLFVMKQSRCYFQLTQMKNTIQIQMKIYNDINFIFQNF